MNTQNNKRLVQTYLDLFGRSDIDGLLAMMPEDATWTIVGKAHLFALAGSHSKAEMEGLWRDLYARLEGGLQMSVTGMIAEDDKVAAEVISEAKTHDGKIYSNAYHLLVTLRDGKVARIKEYTDLMHAAEVFG